MSEEVEGFSKIAGLVAGCRNDGDGIATKKHIVKSYVDEHAAKGDVDYVQVICMLHTKSCISIDSAKAFKAVHWQKPKAGAAGGVQEAGNAGFFLASVLEKAEPGDMEKLVEAYIESNPKVDQIELLRYINSKGYISAAEADLADSVVNWNQPIHDDDEHEAEWRQLWRGYPREKEPEDDSLLFPAGPAKVGSIRDSRGNRAKIAFLGSIAEGATELAMPSALLIKTWRLPPPAMVVTVDGGSMHPRCCDSINRMGHLPQFYDWLAKENVEGVEEDNGAGVTGDKPSKRPSIGAKAKGPLFASAKIEPAPETEHEEAPDTPEIGRPQRVPPPPPPPPLEKSARVVSILNKSCEDWRSELEEIDTDEKLGDGSINNVLFTKLKEVFAALLDACTLGGSYIVVDRTDGAGSATAELLLEMALERGAQKPVIVVIDSLERLGKSKEGARSRRVLKQLHDLFMTEDVLSPEPNGTERDFLFDYKYRPDDFTDPDGFSDKQDNELPFFILPEHSSVKYGGCMPNRKWRYCYIDALFRSGTHIVIKNNDTDSFNIDELGLQGFLYAHGDTRTYKRLRANIQQGRPTVMLHNSGSVTTAFSWLQRVMSFQRPPPETADLQAPLRFLLSNLSDANWTHSFGVPEMLMMRSLAERAPMLFRKNVISVDILTQSEEEVLEAITGCFAQSGGVPELGLGNAEVNVIFNTWMLHLTLCENARFFHRFSVLFQWITWILSFATTLVSVLGSSFGSGIIATALNLQATTPEEAKAALDEGESVTDEGEGTVPYHTHRRLIGTEYVIRHVVGRALLYQDQALVDELLVYLELAVIILPVVLALVVTINSRMAFRDKWSVCIMAADCLASEIYKFRLGTCECERPFCRASTVP